MLQLLTTGGLSPLVEDVSTPGDRDLSPLLGDIAAPGDGGLSPLVEDVQFLPGPGFVS